ncbi:ABC transporter permease [Edaphosphingomonas haloaromaticamans]|uniref:Transport permease protein n=1 Tax=Edaphosphingomonas haloaromaticamans TaxID=653954 RepID=A0A1S1H902_9SPHN|nr:ABC transporter permease [Sphingomonas haloaromaticamans]OHT18292.1 Polysialic acid transport protein KpsM [Sphingomonas haloaromaticamans]
MASLRQGWRVQSRVVAALLIREMHTRFGRENIGFLWMMVEPLLFAGLVALIWRVMKGPEEHGVDIVTFVVSGYIPLVLFRHAVNRSVSIFVANGSLLYHRQVRIIDFIISRFLLEMIGSMMAYVFIATALYMLGFFPSPADVGMLIVGWVLYSLFTLSLCFIIAPLSEMSPVLEKFMPVTTYVMIPFSGTFTMVAWLPAQARELILWSPWVSAMEMMRHGLFGDKVQTYYVYSVPIAASMICTVIGLALCRHVRKMLVVE